MSEALLEALKSKRIVIMDGAIGTELDKLGTRISSRDWVASTIGAAKDLKAIHHAYASAGAEIHIANTFASSKHTLGSVGLEHAFEKINREAVSICREAVNGNKNVKSWIAGSISTYVLGGDRSGLPKLSTLYNNSKEQAQILLDEGCDMLVLETLHDLDTSLTLITAASTTGLPISVGLTVTSDENDQPILIGAKTSEDRNRLALRNILPQILDAIPSDYPWILTIMHSTLRDTDSSMKILAEMWDGMIGVYPNQGIWLKDTGWEHSASCEPNKFVKHAKSWADEGASFIGGCCGFGPDHIKALKKWVSNKFK